MPREVGHAHREYLEQVSPLDLATKAWQPRYLKWSLDIARMGALTREGIPTAQALTEEVAAALPGTPMAIPTPGHTGGHCSYVVDGVLVSGDALVTGHPVSDARRTAAAARPVQPRSGRAASAASPRWACSTPTCCCPAMARCGADRSGRPPSRRRALREDLVADQEDRGQHEPAAEHDRRHQDRLVEFLGIAAHRTPIGPVQHPADRWTRGTCAPPGRPARSACGPRRSAVPLPPRRSRARHRGSASPPSAPTARVERSARSHNPQRFAISSWERSRSACAVRDGGDDEFVGAAEPLQGVEPVRHLDRDRRRIALRCGP